MVGWIGQQFGNYRLVRLLGKGGTAEVYLGEHIYLGTQAAIKVLYSQLASEDMERFRSEARTVAHLTHPHIVHVLDFGVEGTMPFLAMEYASHGTVRTRYLRGTRLPLETIVSYVNQVADALQYIHEQKKLVHRDVKPENMLLRTDQDLLLSDFGISAIEQSVNNLITRKRIGLSASGTTSYMAPEQVQGDPHPASDQYALGIVVYEWLCGSRPFEGEAFAVMYQQVHVPVPPLREKIPTISPAVEHVVLRALAKDSRQRFATIRDFAEALEQASYAQENATLPAWPLSGHPALNSLLAQQSSQTEESATLLAQPFPRGAPSPHSTQPVLNPTPAREKLDSPFTGGYKGPSAHATPKQDRQIVTEPNHAPESARIVKPIHQPRGLFRGKAMLLIGLAAIIVVGSIAFLLSSLNNHSNATSTVNIQSTVNAHASATTDASAIATTAANAYNAATAHGVMLGFDAQHTRVNPYEKVLNVINVSKLVQAWKFSSGGRIGSVPTVADGRVYVSAAGRVSNEGNMYALNAETGHIDWVKPYGTYYNGAGPTVANGTVYIGSDQILYALDAETGAIRWTATTRGSIGTSPTLVNGVIYIGSDDGRLNAFGASNGAKLWTFSTGDRILSSPAVTNGIVYVGSDNGNLYAIKASSGEVIWTTQTKGKIRSSPAVVNGIVYVGSSDDKLYAINADTGKVLWTASTGKSIFSSPAVANGVLYVGSIDDKLYAFRASGCGNPSCQPIWTASTRDRIFSSPTIANGVLYIGSNDDKLYAFKASGCGNPSCQPIWTASTGASIRSSPTVANGFVYVGSEDGNIYAFHVPGTT
jgi:outer membrane protein assembly factor BamB/serine/threonine protein kinase